VGRVHLCWVAGNTCDSMWQVTPCTSEMVSHKQLYSALTFINFNRAALCQFCVYVPLTRSTAVLLRHLCFLRELNSLRLQQGLLLGSRCYHCGDQQTRAGVEAGPRPARTNQREVSQPFSAVACLRLFSICVWVASLVDLRVFWQPGSV